MTSTGAVDADFARVAAIEDIRHQLATAAIATDRMDFDLLASCYLDDATVDLGSFFSGSISEYIESNGSADGLPSLDRTMHALTTSTITVDGDRAIAESYCTCLHSGPEGHPWCDGFVVIYLRFIDTLVCVEGNWVIASRTGIFEWGRNETTGEFLELDPRSLGRRDRTDVRYRVVLDKG
ncbi:MAG: nuclear transport factor 2 family protein [Rhodococcus sp. (in: high G+C Gram-positive bacteria)]|uniref:nuclear transport factor 2 family protein n=1 Tax=Rhodococcus sp. TaxID=1831 RepID=UPI003BAFAF32